MATPPPPTPKVAEAVPEVKPAAPSAAPIASKHAVKEKILALAVDKTGYPADMLDLDLDLEADLGVDTVKQAEIFAAIREMYNIPRDEIRKLAIIPRSRMSSVLFTRSGLTLAARGRSTEASSRSPLQRQWPETPAPVATASEPAAAGCSPNAR